MFIALWWHSLSIIMFRVIPIVSLYQKITLIYLRCIVMFFNELFSHIISLCVSIIFISRPVFMHTRWLYQLNYITLQFLLCVSVNRVYTTNQEFTNFLIDSDIDVRRSCFIILLFQEDYFHKIQPTCNDSSIFIQNSMLTSLFVVHFIADIQC